MQKNPLRGGLTQAKKKNREREKKIKKKVKK